MGGGGAVVGGGGAQGLKPTILLTSAQSGLNRLYRLAS